MKLPVALFLVVGALCIGCSKSGDASASSGSASNSGGGTSSSGEKKSFSSVQQIFVANCLSCHSGSRGKGGLDLSSYEKVMAGGKDGAVVVAGDPDGSILVQALKGEGGHKKMPPNGDFSADDLQTIVNWIKDGATK